MTASHPALQPSTPTYSGRSPIWSAQQTGYARRPYAAITIPPGARFADMVALKGKPDIGEHRELIVGQSVQGRLLIVSFTERALTTRIIGARKATE